MSKIHGSADNWESGKLGLSDEHAVRVSDEVAAAVDKATGLNMQPISIRLPKDLLGALKDIAAYHGVGYQPMIRDVLDRWATREIRFILEARLKETEKAEKAQKEREPLAPPLRKRA